jgi:hypothetical protein
MAVIAIVVVLVIADLALAWADHRRHERKLARRRHPTART